MASYTPEQQEAIDDAVKAMTKSLIGIIEQCVEIRMKQLFAVIAETMVKA